MGSTGWGRRGENNRDLIKKCAVLMSAIFGSGLFNRLLQLVDLMWQQLWVFFLVCSVEDCIQSNKDQSGFRSSEANRSKHLPWQIIPGYTEWITLPGYVEFKDINCSEFRVLFAAQLVRKRVLSERGTEQWNICPEQKLFTVIFASKKYWKNEPTSLHVNKE